ncbi:hypothetical protein HNQ91_003190 [Filimonas zeae]|uniref:Holin n=1 Tax=Filimonas zeae TaxID=1737353 RepID=A0A917J213_9BACT|nr:hypothetical protein [Filimonas zeae]MDR6340125.1 hypothetical protein [Filimonas zeae]GGH71262.1 hypothetical protein GCM10011379_30420 [Filimonas zeae]
MNSNKLISIVQRAQAPTPPFFKKLRNIGLVLAATGGAIMANAADLPAVAGTIASYLTLAGSITGAISQLTITTTDDNSKNID